MKYPPTHTQKPLRDAMSAATSTNMAAATSAACASVVYCIHG